MAGKNNILEKEAIVRLSDLKHGESAIVYTIVANCDSTIRQRLLDLGFVKGAGVTVQNISPMGNPVAYSIHDTLIAIRNEDAMLVEIIKGEKIEDAERCL